MGKSRKLKGKNIDKKRSKRNQASKKKRKVLQRQTKQTKSPADLGPKPPREISPAENLSVEEYVSTFIRPNPVAVETLRSIREQKAREERPLPSKRLISRTDTPTKHDQCEFLDVTAKLVDENLYGRSEMCLQFASLLAKLLQFKGYDAVAYTGIAIYTVPNGSPFEWDHAWVIYDNLIVDGNVDTMQENPVVQRIAVGVNPDPFWGDMDYIPSDREFNFESAKRLNPDNDVETIWWPDLKDWLQR